MKFVKNIYKKKKEMKERREEEKWIEEGTHTRKKEYSERELALASRCAGSLLETLSLPFTPTSLHYKLIHFDVPFIDPTSYSLALFNTSRNFSLSLPLSSILYFNSDIYANNKIENNYVNENNVKNAKNNYLYSFEDIVNNNVKLNNEEVTMAVTMECAGNGRTKMKVRYKQMPWGVNAVGCALWSGVPLSSFLSRYYPFPLSDNSLFIFTAFDIGFEFFIIYFFDLQLFSVFDLFGIIILVIIIILRFI